MDRANTKMQSYYRERAPVYDRVYAYPERQADLRFLEKYIPQQFHGLDVLEVAAGTGYWTQFIIEQANSILSTDITEEALQQIKKRPLAKNVETRMMDAYSLHELPHRYNGAFAGLWLSHIPKQSLDTFLSSLHQCLKPQSTVLFIDNSIAQCERLPITHTDGHGNSYQDRELDDGSIHRVLKNFPSERELVEATRHFGSGHQYLELNHFWLFQYKSF